MAEFVHSPSRNSPQPRCPLCLNFVCGNSFSNCYTGYSYEFGCYGDDVNDDDGHAHYYDDYDDSLDDDDCSAHLLHRCHGDHGHRCHWSSSDDY